MRYGTANVIPDDAEPLTYTVTVTTEGCDPSSAEFTRGGLAQQPTLVSSSGPRDNGIVTAYFRGAGPSRVTVLLFGEGDCGRPGGSQIPALTAAGYGVVSAAYCGVEGLAPTNALVPVETLEKSLAWTRKQPGVDPAKIVVLGISQGSVGAGLLAARHPDEIAGLILSVPIHRVSYSSQRAGASTWTEKGKPLPAGDYVGREKPDPQDPARVRWEAYRGPVLTVCGTSDVITNSCGSASFIAQLRKGLSTTRVEATGAGHEVGGLVPHAAGSARASGTGAPIVEDFAGATALGRQKAWPAVLEFLAKVSSH